MSASRIAERVERAVSFARARVHLGHARVGWRVAATGPLLVRNEGDLVVEDNVIFVGGIVPTGLFCARGSRLSIGAGSMLNYGVSLEAYESIRLGERCMLGSFVRICDRDRSRSAAISLGNDVWVAHGAVVEPGVTIGDGSVVAAGSVVSRDVPANSMAIGNPARIVSLDLLDRQGG